MPRDKSKRDQKLGISFTDKIVLTGFMAYLVLSSATLVVGKAIRDKLYTGKWFPNG